MSQRYTLVVIDMQHDFRSTADLVVWEVCRAIKSAKKNLSHIIVVGYRSCGPMLEPVKKAIGKYPHVSFVNKRTDDGSKEVMAEVSRLKLSSRFRICGVNLDCCVIDTVNGLVKHSGDITLISRATQPNPGVDKYRFLRVMKEDLLVVCII
jgi:nicotinamidase-related amidase